MIKAKQVSVFEKSDNNGICDEDCATCGSKVQERCLDPEKERIDEILKTTKHYMEEQ